MSNRNSNEKPTGGRGNQRGRGGGNHGRGQAGPQSEKKAKSARDDLCVLNYGNSGVLTNLKQFEDELKIITGREFGDLGTFLTTNSYPEYNRPELLTAAAVHARELREARERVAEATNPIETAAANADLQRITARHAAMTEEDTVAENLMLKEEWKLDLSIIKKRASAIDENKSKLFWLIRGQLSMQSEEKVKEYLLDQWRELEESQDPLTLWRAITRTHRAVTSGSAEVDLETCLNFPYSWK
jgi:hypothetical protein